MSAYSQDSWLVQDRFPRKGKERKLVGCSCLVVRDYGEESERLHIVHDCEISSSIFRLDSRPFYLSTLVNFVLENFEWFFSKQYILILELQLLFLLYLCDDC